MKKVLAIICLLCTAAVTSAQVTFTAIDGSAGKGSNEGVASLFDGLSTKWCADASGAWFIFKASKSVYLNAYTMITGNDNASNHGRNPRTWSIYGMVSESDPSKDNEGWNLIQTMTDDPGMNDRNYEAYHFSVNSAKSYNYYKVEIGSVYSGNIVQLSEFIPGATEIDVTKDGVTYAGGTGNVGQPYNRAVDGNSGTNWLAYTWDGNWILFDTQSNDVILKSYALSAVSDATSFSNRTPVSWTWYGSNKTDGQPGKDDNSSWEQIVKITRDLTLFNKKENNARQRYTVQSNSKAYRYYKLVINECDPEGTEDLGGQWGGMFGLSEIELNPCEHVYYTYSLAYFSDSQTFQQVNVCTLCGNTNVGGYSGVVMVDGKNSLCNNGPISGVNISYTRSVSSSMGTICLPYSMNLESKTDATYYTLGSYNSGSDILVFDQVTNTLDAFTPAVYILNDENGTSLNLNSSGALFSVTPTTNVTKKDRAEDGWEMVGTVKNGTASEISKSIYYLKGGDFYRCNGSINFKPYRAYITGPAGGSSVKAFGLADDMEDAINNIMPAENGEIQLYDLSGRKVSKVRNGEIYIMNGRKVMFNK